MEVNLIVRCGKRKNYLTQKHVQNEVILRRFLETVAFSDVNNNVSVGLTRNISKDEHLKTRFPSGYWRNDINKRKFLDNMKKKFSIKDPSEWGKITTRDLRKYGGASLLINHNGSLFKCLKDVYTETNWKKEWFPTLTAFPSSYWSKMENQKNFLEDLKIKFGIKEPKDWGNITFRKFKEAGGTTLLGKYRGSIYNCLQSIYKDIEWKKEWFPNLGSYPLSFWNSLSNCRNFLDELKIKFGIKEPKDWGKLTVEEIKKAGGHTLISNYNGSLFICLKNIYTEIEWKKEWFPTLRNSPVNSLKREKRRQILDEIKFKFGIKEPKEWSKVSIDNFKSVPEFSSIMHRYQGSLFKCLRDIYRDVEWKSEWFQKYPYLYWNYPENSKKFLDEMKIRFNIRKPSDWGKVKIKEIHKYGGVTLLNHYNGSLFICLQNIYSEIEWKKEWFPTIPSYPRAYWKSMENRRKFLDNLKVKLNIKQPRDWGKINNNQIQSCGGSSLLSNIYKNSLIRCLESVYNEIEWKREWFYGIGKYPKAYWNSVDNCRRFLDMIAFSGNIKSTSDWRKISFALIRNKGGEVSFYDVRMLSKKGLLHKHGRSIKSVLKSVYPANNWEGLFSQTQTSQGHLEKYIKDVFGEEKVSVNHRRYKY